jgi:hypothetical protein
MTQTTNEVADLIFTGANWEDLARLVGLARFAFLQDNDFANDEPMKCAWLAARFRGPALDWAVNVQSRTPAVFDDFDTFVTNIREAFGVADLTISAIQRTDLERLRWSHDIPVFFATFDRLTLQLGLTNHETRIALLKPKLPVQLSQKLAEQALNFANYETMRERLITMWALDPNRGLTTSHGEGGRKKKKEKSRVDHPSKN